jgi:hypothetical protein
MRQIKLIIAALFLFSPFAANAAFISIDDSDVDSITITVGDFENCFSVNMVQLTCGLGNSNSITLLDGLIHSFEGSWIDLGGSGTTGEHYFGLLGDVFSGVEWTAATDGFVGTISGLFTGLDSCCNYGPPSNGILNPQDGSARDFSQPYSRNTFTSEAAPVPEPSTLALFGIGLFGVGLARRKRKV